MNSQYIIDKLQLLPHPEGGFYKETYRSAELVNNKDGNKRNLSTTIYYLLEGKHKSHFHRIQSDEFWFFHLGEPIEILFFCDCELKKVTLGNSIPGEELPQARIPTNT